jgi:segregation and condensation protein B
MELKDIESAVEAILFASGDPISVQRIAQTLEIESESVEQVIQHLADYYSYERRGIRLLHMEDCYQLASAPEYADQVRRAMETRRPPQLSQAALESLAVIAYFQPTTKAYVEQIRGVDSSYTVGLLADRGLIEECGRLTVPGRPILYATTQAFLRSFGLHSLEDLPPLPDSSPEDGQITLDMQAAISKLKEQEQALEEAAPPSETPTEGA